MNVNEVLLHGLGNTFVMTVKNQTPDLISDKTVLIQASCDPKSCPLNINTHFVTTLIYHSMT